MNSSAGESARSPSFASRMPLWSLTSFLVAVGLRFVIEQFLPSVVSLAPGISALPVLARSIVLVFVLMLLGVVIQAAWWAAHRQTSDDRM